MLNNVQSLFNEFIKERTSQVETEITKKNSEYIDARNKAAKLFLQIKDLLPEELKHLLFDYESLLASQEGISEVIMYQQGLKDYGELKEYIKPNGRIK